MTRWKAFPGFDGLYSVSDDGKVLNRKLRKKLHPSPDGKGYMRVCLRKNGLSYNKSVHQAMAVAFLGDKRATKTVNHKNGIKSDNRLENLEWLTNAQNMAHAAKLGLRPHPDMRGERNNSAVLSTEDIEYIRLRYNSGSLYQRELAKEYNVTQQTISDIIRGHSWAHLLPSS